jgi:outer membrane lipoprotein
MVSRNAALGLVSAFALVVLASCSPPFPKELLEKAETNIPFAALQKEPARFSGKLVLLGGTIVGTKNLKEGTRIEVLQRPLDSETRPASTDESGGRFLILSREFLDDAVYQRGRPITVIGVVAPPQVLPLGELEYRYPVINAQALHLWSPYAGPRFSIGVGVYRGF